MAFGDFHGFVAGWTYWTYTIFYFPGLLLASAAMASYVGGSRSAWLAENQTFLVCGSLVLLIIAVWLNIIGLHIGKWLQNAGGLGTYIPLLMIVGVALWLWGRQGSVTHFTWADTLPHWSWGTLNFWSRIAFAFTGLELVSALSEEVRDPQRTLPKAIFASGGLIAVIYMAGTIAILTMIPADVVDPKSGVFQAITTGSVALRFGILGVIAALLVTAGNAGGVGSTVAGISRVPFVVGIDRYLPPWFGKIHPKWKTPHISILVQAGLSAAVLLLSQFKATERTAYAVLVSAAIVLYFIPFIYMYAAVIKLAWKEDRGKNKNAVLIPGGKAGVCICGILGLLAVIAGILFSLVPPGEETNTVLFEIKVLGGTVATIAVGMVLYYRGARQKSAERVGCAGFE
jgi:amino acid transporter